MKATGTILDHMPVGTQGEELPWQKYLYYSYFMTGQLKTKTEIAPHFNWEAYDYKSKPVHDYDLNKYDFYLLKRRILLSNSPDEAGEAMRKYFSYRAGVLLYVCDNLFYKTRKHEQFPLIKNALSYCNIKFDKTTYHRFILIQPLLYKLEHLEPCHKNYETFLKLMKSCDKFLKDNPSYECKRFSHIYTQWIAVKYAGFDFSAFDQLDPAGLVLNQSEYQKIKKGLIIDQDTQNTEAFLKKFMNQNQHLLTPSDESFKKLTITLKLLARCNTILSAEMLSRLIEVYTGRKGFNSTITSELRGSIFHKRNESLLEKALGSTLNSGKERDKACITHLILNVLVNYENPLEALQYTHELGNVSTMIDALHGKPQENFERLSTREGNYLSFPHTPLPCADTMFHSIFPYMPEDIQQLTEFYYKIFKTVPGFLKTVESFLENHHKKTDENRGRQFAQKGIIYQLQLAHHLQSTGHKINEFEPFVVVNDNLKKTFDLRIDGRTLIECKNKWWTDDKNFDHLVQQISAEAEIAKSTGNTFYVYSSHEIPGKYKAALVHHTNINYPVWNNKEDKK